jgi:hypothetical protein
LLEVSPVPTPCAGYCFLSNPVVATFLIARGLPVPALRRRRQLTSHSHRGPHGQRR